HSAQPAAPVAHCEPDAACSKNFRPLPEHCTTAAIVSVANCLSCATLILRGCFTPVTSSIHASGSWVIDRSGIGRLLRTKNTEIGVIALRPKLERFVSSVSGVRPCSQN